jgi:hypothetical protein
MCGPSRHVACAVILSAVCGSTTGVLGQNALGDGRALDNSLSTRGRYNDARPDLRSELRFRNAVVTGNAPDGLSFRGDVGYVAPGEFAGALGSNDLFAFRRDSLRSGIAGMGIRGTEALQYQMSLTTGSRPPANLVGSYTVRRSGAGEQGWQVPSSQLNIAPGGLEQRPAIDPQADDRGTMLWMLRSPSAYMSNSSLQTSAMRLVQGDDGVYTMTASPLRGVRLSPVPELAGAEEDERSGSGVGAPPRMDAANTTPSAQDTRIRQGGEEDEAGDEVETMHGEILRRLGEQEARRRQQDVFDPGPSISERVQEMARKLREEQPEAEEPDEPVAEDPEEDPFVVEGDGQEWTREPAPDLTGGSAAIRFDPETMRLLRGDGTPIERYVTADAGSRDFYAEHLLAGQRLMAEGRYFDAEERFAHALGVKRGDVTAQVARLHAQIGAGLFLSASLNLQSLVLERPEVFGARYAPELLPSPERLSDLVQLFRETIDPEHQRSRVSSPSVRRASGLLLAYLGYQMDRRDLIAEGLDSYRERVRAGTESGEPLPIEARLEVMLRALWLPDQAGSSGQPTPPPAGAAPDDG